VTPDQLRRYGRQVVDWIADYLERVETLPVQSPVAPGDVRARLPDQPPRRAESFESILRDMDDVILPGITHWQSPNFFGFFPANSSGPSILGELLSAGLAVQGMMWITSPACTELETHVLDWMVGMLGLPQAFLSTSAGGGVIQDSASSASLCALLAARHKASLGTVRQRGVEQRLVAYASAEAHASIEKAMRVAGLGSRHLRLIATDERHAMKSDVLEETIRRDQATGLHPFFVVSTVGTTSSGAVDPTHGIGQACRKYGLWLHVDAAMAGTAAICPELRDVHRGVELADSYCFNPHKWMFVNFDCDCLFVADRSCLIRALGNSADYLENTASTSGKVIDYRNWQIPLGRRFRALKLWFVIRSFGVDGLRDRVREHVKLARELAGWIEADRRFEMAAPVALNLVCFRHSGGEAASRRLVEHVNREGRIFLTQTRLDELLTLRLCIGQTSTQRQHVARAWSVLCDAADQVA